MPNINPPVPGADQFYPLNEPEIGSAYSDTNVYPQNKTIPALFQPLTLRDVTFKNRIFAAPMCQYSSDNGHATDWHLVHIGGFATRGAAAICMEASAVVPEGRITPQDAGIWTDSQIAPLKRIVDFTHAQGTKIGIQLSHAGRKASTLAPWIHSDVAKSRAADTYIAKDGAEKGWPSNVYAPSEIAFSDDYPNPKAMTLEDLQQVEDAFIAAVERSEKAGFDFIEIHCAHGYLFHSFFSPLSNTRTDEYGGQEFDNRVRYALKVIERCRSAWKKPLFVRISASDWAEGPEKVGNEWKQWGIEQSIEFVKKLEPLGVDLVDCSSGGNWQKQKIPVHPGYQVPFAEAVKKACPKMSISAVGLITDPQQAESYLQEGKADVVRLARGLLRDPNFPLRAAQELGVSVKAANQYERAWTRMLVPKHQGENTHGKEQGM